MELSNRMKLLSRRDTYPFHMPGHKNVFPQLFNAFDPTELPGLDNLHCPKTVLKRAQCRIAELYKTAGTFFLVNGSSVGIMAGIVAFSRRDDEVLVQRNCHKAVLAGLIHSGAMPVWVEQGICPQLNHWLPPSQQEISRLMAAHSIKMAVLANPDYYGQVTDLVDLASMFKAKNIVFIVDEAHGAHLNWGQNLGLPVSGVNLGDVTVQSPHKTLPALTQAAWMHIKDRAFGEVLQDSLNLFHTTSPSYLLLRSLEFAGCWAEANGYEMLRRLKLMAITLETKAKQLSLQCGSTVAGRDWTKFVLPRRRGILKLLLGQGIYPELVEGDKLLFMLTMADAVAPKGIAALHRALSLVAKLPVQTESPIVSPPLPQQEVTPREAWRQRGQRVPLEKALGRISRQVLAPYPPGTMVVAPGQRLGREHIDYLNELQVKKVISQWIEVI